MKRDCKEFDDMMRKTNVGIPKDKWKPPEGYKSALGRARDAARNKSPGKVNAITSDAEDTASDSDLSDADSINFNIRAMRPVKGGVPLNEARMNAVNHLEKSDKCAVTNRFQGLSDGALASTRRQSSL